MNVAEKLKDVCLGTRVKIHWLGESCKMEEYLKADMASAVNADADSLSISKKLFNTKLPVIRQATKVRTAVRDYWKGNTLPYPEPGIRLLKKDDLSTFDGRLSQFRTDLEEAARQIQQHRQEILQDARKRLGSSFQEGNYPQDLSTLFGLDWGYPSIDPPEYLASLAPEIYEQERQRAAQRLEDAVRLAEQAFYQEFQTLIANLLDRLTPDADGKKKVFKDSTIHNLTEFFERFGKLNLTGNDDLEQLVAQAKTLLGGFDPDDFRDSPLLRKETAKGLTEVSKALEPPVAKAPRRKVLKPKKPQPLEVA